MQTSLKKQLWISASVIFGSVIIAVIAVNYLANDIATKTAQIVRDRSLVTQQSSALSVLADLKAQAPAAATYQTAMDKLLPSEDGLIGFGDWLNGIAAADQVTANFSFQGNAAPASPGIAGRESFNLDVEGPINNIVTFLADIESKSPGFLLTIISFDLTAQSSGYRFSAQGTVFSRP